MKRSEINHAIQGALKLFEEYKVSLPPFVTWTPEQWKEKGEEAYRTVDLRFRDQIVCRKD